MIFSIIIWLHSHDRYRPMTALSRYGGLWKINKAYRSLKVMLYFVCILNTIPHTFKIDEIANEIVN